MKNKSLTLIFAAALVSTAVVALAEAPPPRPTTQPVAVAAPVAAPEGAIVLFGGKDTAAWQTPQGEKIPWTLEGGVLVSKQTDIETKRKFNDFTLHVEFNEPLLPPDVKDQARGNSGVYLQGRYEIQVLDTYENNTYNVGRCGAVYGVKGPDYNACLPADRWQTYDITFRAARWDGGRKVEPARVTILQNGITIQNDVPIPGPTGGGAEETPDGGPIRLQFHHNSVKYRNVWIVPGDGK